MFVQPLSIRTLGRNRALDLFVIDDTTLLGVNEEHATWLNAALAHDVFGRHFEHAGFGCDDDHVIFGDVVTRRTQTVAIENRADLLTVGERDRCRTVPWLHQR